MGFDSKNGGEVGADNSLPSICYKKGSLRLLDQHPRWHLLPPPIDVGPLISPPFGASVLTSMPPGVHPPLRFSLLTETSPGLALIPFCSHWHTAWCPPPSGFSLLTETSPGLALIPFVTAQAHHYQILSFLGSPMRSPQCFKTCYATGTKFTFLIETGSDPHLTYPFLPEKKLLYSRGGLPEQGAAFGIAVWNPAFDVTLVRNQDSPQWESSQRKILILSTYRSLFERQRRRLRREPASLVDDMLFCRIYRYKNVVDHIFGNSWLSF
ncbi:hypothetical protein SDJN02_14735, partial [Cucurbita argyrosperma subsp. argyrosperma]